MAQDRASRIPKKQRLALLFSFLSDYRKGGVHLNNGWHNAEDGRNDEQVGTSSLLVGRRQ